MSKFTFLVMCKGGSINLREFLDKTPKEIRIDFVDEQLQCYIDIEAITPSSAGILIGKICDDFKDNSGEVWTLDQDYDMDGETYSLDQDEPLGRYLSREGYWV